MINYVKGDATQPQGEGNKVIAHVCNDLGRWGAGFVMAISNRWPHVRDDYLNWATGGDQWFGLGMTRFVEAEPGIWIANMVAQRGLVNSKNPKPLHSSSLQWALAAVDDFAWRNDATVHMPRIGCGLAGGKWENDVEPILKNVFIQPKQFKEYETQVTVYDFE